MAATAFKNDPMRVMHVTILAIFSFFALAAVILRLWSRKIQRHAWDLSDYLIVMGLVWALAETVFTMYSNVFWYVGQDVTQFGNPEARIHLVETMGKAILVGELTWAVSVFFIRAAIIALYTRLFFRTKSFRITCYITHGFNTAFFASIILSVFLTCLPFSNNWKYWKLGRTCGDQKTLSLYFGTFNLLLDIAVVILPMPVLWGLQMALKKKVVISGMFGMGIIICVLTLTRICISTRNVGSNAQQIYSLIALFTCLEALLGVINACLPVLKPIFTKLGSSKASSWLASAISGSIVIFVRPSQLGSHWRSKPDEHSNRRDSTIKQPVANKVPLVQRWPISTNAAYNDLSPIDEVHLSPVPRLGGFRPRNLIFPSPTSGRFKVPSRQDPIPPVPPQGTYYDPAKRLEMAEGDNMGSTNAIHVRKEWDVERGESEESIDRQRLVRGIDKW